MPQTAKIKANFQIRNNFLKFFDLIYLMIDFLISKILIKMMFCVAPITERISRRLFSEKFLGILTSSFGEILQQIHEKFHNFIIRKLCVE